MEPTIKKDILDILKRVIQILKIKEKKDILELKDLSNHTIHDASIYQDLDSISIATLIYALYKIFDRNLPLPPPDYQNLINYFQQTYSALQKNEFRNYNRYITKLFSLIKKIDLKYKIYLEEVLDKAKITKGSKIFEHGLSLGRAAEIMGLTQWELTNYIGRTHALEQSLQRFKIKIPPVQERFNFTKKIFSAL